MDEAYTIGLRLALDDGVSAGLSAIGAQMAALDRTVAAGLSGLERLRMLGDKAVERPVAAMARQLPGRPAEAGAPPEVEADSGRVPVQQAGGERGLPFPAPRRDTVAAPPGPAVAPVPVWADAPAVAAPLRMPPPMTMAIGTLPSDDGDAMTSPSPVRPVGLPALSPLTPAMAPVPDWRPRPMLEPLPAAPEPMAADVVDGPMAPAPEVRPYAMAVAPMRAVAGMLPPSREAAQERGGESSQGRMPTQGDVYLDGIRMGRWIADHLARAAERPQGGSTGFDGRMSPSLGGIL